MKTCCFRAAFVAAAIVLVSTAAFPQATLSMAQLNGTVLDGGGRSVANAQISARQVDTNQAFSATTNNAGFYVLPALPPGHYSLTVTSSGFAKYQQNGLTLSVGQVATVNVSLKVASVGEVVT